MEGAMSSNYAWIPPHRPPPADPSLAGKIALLGPVGKCLETALDELLAEDRAAVRDGDGEGCASETTDHATSGDEWSNRKRKRAAESDDDGNEDNESAEESSGKDQDGDDTSASTPANNLRLDESMSQSILAAYGKAVTDTKFDTERQKSATQSDDTDIAPAALLKGEIDHFNRVGGQWRLVVKNAVLKERSTTKMVINKRPGRTKRRTILDWGGSGDDNAEKESESASAGNRARKAPDVHEFPGTMQILAYDDDT